MDLALRTRSTDALGGNIRQAPHLTTAANKGKANHNGGASHDSSSNTPSVLMISSISLCDACQALNRGASLTAKANVAALRSALRRARPVALLTLQIIAAHPKRVLIIRVVICRTLALWLPLISLNVGRPRRAATGLVLIRPFSTTASSSLRPLILLGPSSPAKTDRTQPLGALLLQLSSAPDKARPKAATKAPLTDPSASPFVSWTHRQQARRTI